MILVKKHTFYLIPVFLLCSVSSAFSSSFESCQLKVKIQELSSEMKGQKKEKGFKIQMNFKPKELVEGKCSKLIGKDMKKDVLVRSKQTLHQLSKGEHIVLDYSSFSGMTEKGDSLSMETWKLVNEKIDRGVDFKSSKGLKGE